MGLSRPAHSRLYTYSQLKAEPDPEWVIDGIIPEGFVELHAPPKTGKTFVALDWALTVASGQESWIGHAVKKSGAVVYICGEGFTGIKGRVGAWLEAKYGRNVPRGVLDSFLVHKGPVEVSSEGAVTTLTYDLKARNMHPVLIVVDTLARCFGKGEDENSPTGMANFINGCDQLREAFPGSTLLVLHHTPKNSPTIARGHGSLKGAVEAELVIVETSTPRVFRLGCTAMKDAEPFKTMALRLESVGKSAVVGRYEPKASKPRGRSGKLTPDQTLLRGMLKGKKLTHTVLENQFLAAPGMTKWRFDQALKKLRKMGKICKDGDGKGALLSWARG